MLAEHEMRAIGYYESEIASDQAEALKRYEYALDCWTIDATPNMDRAMPQASW